MAADSPVAGGPDEGHGPEEGRGRRRGIRLWNLLKAAVHLALAALVIGVSAFFFLTRSGPGQRWVVDEVLQRVAGGLRGRVTIEELWSANLLEGVSLRGVSIVGPDGRPFLEVDSLRARYSALQLVAGPLVFSDVAVYRPRVRIATLPGEERSNLDVIFGALTDPAGSSAGEAGEGQRGAAAEGAAAPEGVPVPGESAAVAMDSARARTDGAPREIVLRDVRLVDASLEYLEPLGDEDTGRVVVVEAPGGGRLRRIEVGNVQARLPRAVLSSPDFEGVAVDVASLALDARIFRDPLRVEELRGRLRWVDGTFSLDADDVRLPESVLAGTAVAETGGEEGTVLTLDLSASPLVLADVAWVEPRMPSGTVVGGIGLVVAPGLLEGTFRDADATLGDDRIRADGGVALAETGVRFAEMDLRLEPLDLDRLRPWSEAEIPLEGRLEGSLNLDGSLRSLRTRGWLALTPPGAQDATTRVTLEGVLRVGSDPGATDLVATFDPLDYRTLARLVADSTAFGGVGSATVEATGALSDGVRFTAEAVHREGALPPSHLMVRGSVRRANGAMVLDIQGDVSPLSVTSLRSYAPNLPVTGEVSGSIRARGPLSDLTLTAMLDTEAGRLDLESRFDALDPGRSYRVEGTIEDVPLGRFVPNLPEPSRVSGEVFVEGSGLSPESARASGRLTLRPSIVAGIDVDTLELSFQVQDGVAALDTLEAVAVGVELRAGGRIPFRPTEEEGVIRVGFVGESLEGFRTLVRGERVIARDTLEGLEIDVAEASGVDLDTLPMLEDVAVGGRLEGEVVVRGSMEDLRADGEARFEEVVWGRSSVRGARIRFDATGLPGLDGRIRATVEADSLDVVDRRFSGAELVVDYTRPEGTLTARLTRTDDEDYRARATVRLDSLGGQVALEELALRFDTVTWNLQSPAEIRWADDALEVDELVVMRPGPDPMRLRADGRFPRRGEADFTLDVDGLELSRLARIAQLQDQDIRGSTDLTLRVTGSADAPVIHGDVTARDVAYESWSFGLLLGSFDYRELGTAVDLRAWRADRQVLVATGTVPVDLRLVEVESRIPEDRTMDVRVVADSLPAAFAVTLLEALDDVEGTIAGDFRIGGTIDAPSPSGTLAIQDAAWTLTALGVRQEDVHGTLTLEPDGVVRVDAEARAGGTARVSGTIALEPLDDPTFDLVLAFDDFRAIDRRDIAGTISGELTLKQRLREPLVQGLGSQGRGLSARGDLYVEEFQRTASVIDLSDPRFADFLEEGFMEGAQPIIAESRNPFLDNLRVEVDVAVERDTWLRSTDMNVEISGNLTMTYNRQQRDLVLQGVLQAIRGSYTTLGKRFVVQEGTVEFVGTPGVNPNLSIRASTQVRRSEGDPLDITASVTGTLGNPRLQLSSDEQAVAQEDLVSYLLFGRPSYELTSGQAQGVQEAGQLLGSAVTGGISGALTSQISSLLGQRFGLDYFAISSGSLGLGSGTSSAALRQTTVELGGYLGEELFWVLTLRPAGAEGSSTLGAIPGVRLEWQATDLYSVEAFIDDRYLRSGAAGFRELAFQSYRVFGLSVFREWTY